MNRKMHDSAETFELMTIHSTGMMLMLMIENTRGLKSAVENKSGIFFLGTKILLSSLPLAAGNLRVMVVIFFF